VKKDMIELVRVSKIYNTGDISFSVLKDVTLRIKEGEIAAIVGPSGSGKTTLLNIIGTLDTASNGKVFIDGEEVNSADSKGLNRIRKEKIGFIFQFYNLFPTLTAAENVEAGLEMLDIKKGEIKKRTAEYLELVGMGSKMNKFPSQLSGGEQQRVAIARALSKNPKLILGDEPTGNLDEATGNQIVKLMLEINRKMKTTFVIVTHNPKIAKICHKIIKIKDGSIQ